MSKIWQARETYRQYCGIKWAPGAAYDGSTGLPSAERMLRAHCVEGCVLLSRSVKEKALPRLLRYRALGQVNTMTSTVPTALFRSSLESIELPCTEPQDAARRRSNLSQKAIAFGEDGFPVPIEKHL